MTTYSGISNAIIDQDSPLTQDLLTLLRDNPIAQAEGATGSQRTLSQALNLTTVQQTSYAGIADGSVVLASTDMTFSRAFRWLVCGEFNLNTTAQTGTSALRFQGSANNSTWTTIQVLASSTGTQADFNIARVVAPGTAYRYYRVIADGDADHVTAAAYFSMTCIGAA